MNKVLVSCFVLFIACQKNEPSGYSFDEDYLEKSNIPIQQEIFQNENSEIRIRKIKTSDAKLFCPESIEWRVGELKGLGCLNEKRKDSQQAKISFFPSTKAQERIDVRVDLYYSNKSQSSTIKILAISDSAQEHHQQKLQAAEGVHRRIDAN